MRSGLLVAAMLCLATAVPAEVSAPDVQRTYDLWIRNGTVIDGTGQPRFKADVLVTGDTIDYVGKVDSQAVHAHRILDAAGKIVSPGFIDAHSHGEPLSESFANFLNQGITTVVLGQDGATAGFESDTAPKSLAEWLRRVDERRSETNIAALSGFGTLRTLAGVGVAPVPTDSQLAAMQQLLRGDLAAGAFGMSFGLEYSPDRFSQPAEGQALGAIVGEYGGVVMSHMRSEDTDKIGRSIDELLKIPAHVHVSHIKIVAGHQPSEAQAVLDQLARARTGGHEVTADVYPYLASSSDFVFLYPDWAKSRTDYDVAVRDRRAELEAHIRKRVAERNGPEAILITGGRYAGKTAADLAKQLGQPFEKVIIDELGYGGPEQAHFLMSAAVQDQFITADDISISTDGGPGSHHPRSYGSFIKVLEDYVGPAPKMTLERAIYKMSGLTARTVGIQDRGVIAAGRKADLLVLAPKGWQSRASWLQPQRQPTGIEWIVVNGQMAYQNGRADSHRYGRVLRKTYNRPYSSTYRAPYAPATLIRGATILTGTGQRIDGGDLLLVGGRVEAIGHNLAPPEGAVVIDAQGRWVTPGLIDIHSHVGVVGTPDTDGNSDGNEATSPITSNVWVEHSIWPQDPGFEKALEGGVTTLQILPGSSNLVGGRSIVVKNVAATSYQQMKFPGAAVGLKLACGENPKRTYGEHGQAPSTRMGNIAVLRQAFADAQEYRQQMHKQQATPPRRDLKLETLAGVLDGEIRVQMHCYRADEMMTMLDVADEFGFHIAAFHHAVEAYKIADQLAAKGVCAALWSDWWGFKMEAYDGIQENLPMVDYPANGCAVVHSDSADTGQRLNQEAAKAMARGERAGLHIPPERAIRWLTFNSAKALGLEDRIGSLEPGKMADVVLWNRSPFSVYALADEVFIDGAPVFDRAHPSNRPRSDFMLGQAASEALP
ncbi:MAG: amidohydrolase family protein [Proteobacteria bacterium]|nr:amidohydrolase family protein [Pseudomonadota bacterium]